MVASFLPVPSLYSITLRKDQAILPKNVVDKNVQWYSEVGYVRVSSFEQNPERQLEQVQIDRLFTDKASGKDTHRPQLEALLAFVREGDVVVVHSMDRLASNLDDLRKIVQDLTKRSVRIEFVKENLSFTGEDSPMANLMLSVMAAFAEFERALIRERQREEIAPAKLYVPFISSRTEVKLVNIKYIM
ncbi:recombinase family protein [Paenibacillus elgii]|nr:recombinase family protein [Paenibacillus elgii]